MNFAETLKCTRLNVMVDRGYRYSPMGTIGNANYKVAGSPPARRPGWFMSGICTLIAFKRTLLSPKSRHEEIRKSAVQNKVRIYVGNLCGLIGRSAGEDDTVRAKGVLGKLVILKNLNSMEDKELYREISFSIQRMAKQDRAEVIPKLQQFIKNENSKNLLDGHAKILNGIYLSMLVGGQLPQVSIRKNVNSERLSPSVPAPISSNYLDTEDVDSVPSNKDGSPPESSHMTQADNKQSDTESLQSVPVDLGVVSTDESSKQKLQEEAAETGKNQKKIVMTPTDRLGKIFEEGATDLLPEPTEIDRQLMPSNITQLSLKE